MKWGNVSVDTVLDMLFGGGTQAGLGIAFLVAAGCVVLAGIKLSRYGDALGERTGLGAGLVGLVFLAGVTSLPELVVSSTATLRASLQAAGLGPGADRDALLTSGANLALGNMLGSNVFNLMLFALMDILHREGALAYRLSRKHILTAAAGLGLLGLVLFGLACERTTGYVVPWLQVGVVTPLLLAGYLVATGLQTRLERRVDDVDEHDALTVVGFSVELELLRACVLDELSVRLELE